MMVAGGVLGLAALIPFSMGVTYLKRDYRLAHDGASVQGTVDRLDQVSYATSQPGGTRTGTRVSYSFRGANDVMYHATETPTLAFVKGLRVGRPVAVRYVRSDPEVSQLESRPFLGYFFTAMGALFLVLTLGVFVAGVRQVGAGTSRGFIETTGTVTDVDRGEIDGNGDETYGMVRFQFVDAAGQDHWGKSPPLPPVEARAHAVGSRVRIRYKPGDPSVTRWLG